MTIKSSSTILITLTHKYELDSKCYTLMKMSNK